MTANLTIDNVIVVVLVCAVLLFWCLEKAIKGLFRYIRDGVSAQAQFTFAELDKYCRIASAELVLKFVSMLVKVAAGLAVAVSFYKAFADVALLMLPDRTLGVAVLMSYCGLITAVGVVSTDISDAVKRLFARSN